MTPVGTAWIAETLWDLTASIVGRSNRRQRSSTSSNGSTVKLGAADQQSRYDRLVEEMKQTHGVRVRESGGAVPAALPGRSGIQADRDREAHRSPISPGTHELPSSSCTRLATMPSGWGLQTRCLEEYHVWVWALEQCRIRALTSLRQSGAAWTDPCVTQSPRPGGGLKQLPSELAQYL